MHEPNGKEDKGTHRISPVVQLLCVLRLLQHRRPVIARKPVIAYQSFALARCYNNLPLPVPMLMVVGWWLMVGGWWKEVKTSHCNWEKGMS